MQDFCELKYITLEIIAGCKIEESFPDPFWLFTVRLRCLLCQLLISIGIEKSKVFLDMSEACHRTSFAEMLIGAEMQD